MTNFYHPSHPQGLNNDAAFSFPPSNPFSTPRTGTPTSSSHHPLDEQPPSPSHPRKGSFAEASSPRNDLPPAYSPETWQKGVPKGPPQDGAPLALPRRLSRSVSPAGRLPEMNRDPSAAETNIAMGQHEHVPLYINEGHDNQGYHGYGGSWRGPGGYWNTPYARKIHRRKMIASIAVFVSFLYI